MRKIFNGSFTGSYPPVGDASQADCVIGFEFSHRPETMPVGRPNIEIAIRMDEEPVVESLELFASRSVTRGLEHIGSSLRPDFEFFGESARGLQENLGTAGEWRQAIYNMREHDLRSPLLFSSVWNIGNLVFQGLKISREFDYPVQPIVLAGQPRSFDSNSEQFWTKNLARWRATTHLRQVLLRKRGH